MSIGLLTEQVKQPGVEEQIISVVRAADAIDHCEVHSFYPPIVRAARALEPRMAAALLTEGSRVVDWSDFWGFALSLNAQGVSVHYSHVTPERAREAQRRSLTVMTWTPDEDADIERMISAGVDSICSNYPDKVRRLLDAKLAHLTH